MISLPDTLLKSVCDPLGFSETRSTSGWLDHTVADPAHSARRGAEEAVIRKRLDLGGGI
jgi:hypothetical protein